MNLLNGPTDKKEEPKKFSNVFYDLRKNGIDLGNDSSDSECSKLFKDDDAKGSKKSTKK